MRGAAQQGDEADEAGASDGASPLISVLAGRQRVKKGFAAAVLGVAGTLVACNSVPPRQAEGFRPELLGRLSLGMSEADIITLLGAPLRREGAGRGTQARQLLTYAEYGALIKGDVSIVSKGYDCFLWLDAGQLDEVWFADTTTHKSCHCNKGACPPDWALPCEIPRRRNDDAG